MAFDNQRNTGDYSLQNRLYTVIIRQDQENVPEKVNGNRNPAYGNAPPRFVVGSLPESFQINQRSEWRAATSGGLIDEDGVIGKALAVTGNRLVAQVATMQVWQGSGSDLEFSLTFEFRTWSDPQLDVINPLQTLLSMTLPSLSDNGFLRSPGAYLDPAQAKKVTKDIVDSVEAGGGTAALTNKTIVQDAMFHKVSIAIGKWLYFDNVVITGVDHTIHGHTPYRGTVLKLFGEEIGTPKGKGLPQAATVVMTFRPMFMMTEEDLTTMFSDAIGEASAAGAIAMYNGTDALSLEQDLGALIDLFDPLQT